MAELLGAADAGQCHEAEHAEDVHGTVVAFGQREVTGKAGEQAVGAQGRQAAEDATEDVVRGGFKPGGGAVGQAERGGGALVGAGAASADALGGGGIALAALGFGARGGIGGGSARRGAWGFGEPTSGNGFA